MKKLYCIDLDAKCPEVMEYSEKEVIEDMEYLNVSNPMELNNYDRRVFDSEYEAENYLLKFLHIKQNLDNLGLVRTKKLTTLQYRRHYLIQTILGDKMQTFRDSPYVKKIMSDKKSGDRIYLSDQTYTLEVEILKIETIKDSIKITFKNIHKED